MPRIVPGNRRTSISPEKIALVRESLRAEPEKASSRHAKEIKCAWDAVTAIRWEMEFARLIPVIRHRGRRVSMLDPVTEALKTDRQIKPAFRSVLVSLASLNKVIDEVKKQEIWKLIPVQHPHGNYPNLIRDRLGEGLPNAPELYPAIDNLVQIIDILRNSGGGSDDNLRCGNHRCTEGA